MVEEVIGQSRFIEERQNSENLSITDHIAKESILSVEKIAKALGRKFSANNDILRFSVTVENLSEGYKTLAILDGPQEEE
jgi:hypothetical protein